METVDGVSRDDSDAEKNKELLRAVVQGRCSIATDGSSKGIHNVEGMYGAMSEVEAAPLTIRDVVEPNDHSWNASWDSIDIVSFEIYVLDYVHTLSKDVLSRRERVKEERQKESGRGVVQVASEKEFPRLEARIASPRAGSGRNVMNSKESKRRIVPTAVQSVEINTKFLVDEESVGTPAWPATSSSSSSFSWTKKTTTTNKEDEEDNNKNNNKNSGSSRVERIMASRSGFGTPEQGFKKKAQSRMDDGALAVGRMTLEEDEHSLQSKVVDTSDALGDGLKRLACLHGRVLGLSSTMFMTSEISFLFQMLTVDVSASEEKKENNNVYLGIDGFTCGMDAVQYAACVLLHAGNLVLGLGVKVLQDMKAYLDVISRNVQIEEVRKLKNVVMDTLERHEPWGGLVQSPSFHTQKNTGCLTGHMGLNVFLNDDDMNRKKSPDGQRKLSNREAFRDSWFKLMKEAVRQSTSLSELQQHGKIGHHHVPEERHGEATVLKLLQEESSRLLRGLRLDNYEAFAELFVAAVLQAAATGEALMDEELTGIAKQNVSRFQSLNKRFQLQNDSKKPGFGGPRNDYQNRQSKGRVSYMSKRTQVDQSAEHALNVAGEFTKALRPFVLFLEASDSHRLDMSLIRVMRAKLEHLVQCSPDDAPTSLDSGGLLGIDEICVSTTALAGFLGYLSFTKGDSVGVQSRCCNGEYDGSHQLDVLYYLNLCLESPPHDSRLGMLYKIMPWISRYLKFLSWNKKAAESLYFQRVFSIVGGIRRHPYLQARSRSFRGSACLSLRSILDDLAWQFQPYMERADTPGGQTKSWVDSILREDIVWANANLGRRYVETACPDLSSLGKIFSKKSIGSLDSTQVPRRVRKITPTAPSQVTQTSMTLVGQKETTTTPVSHQQVLIELEKVFLDQYSTSTKVTDIKLRDFVAWCSDAIARKGVAAGLDQAVTSCCEIFENEMKEQLEQYAASCVISQTNNASKGRVDKQKLEAVCTSADNLFRSTFYDTVRDASIKALRDTIQKCSKSTVELLLPDAWGPCVKMTAAAIIARRAEAAGTGQCLTELPHLAQTRIRSALEGMTSTYMSNSKKENS
ncbi:hypothetical protein M9435_006515 [Picochlorum sp. BPE23]|nr:hypothetical protein M9435_006515 [Picochlorum sp. BPE23]